MVCANIFVIEDDQAIREIFQSILEMEGYKVESFENGKVALERLRSCPDPCLILLDLMMPVMNGIEFMLEFTRLSEATVVPIPVFLCSANSNEKASQKMGCQGFIKKPLDLGVLLMIVESYCRNNERAA